MKIEPKYEDGEPVCSGQDGGCPSFPKNLLNLDSYCWGYDGACIPALRRDRDQAIKERDEARRTVCKKDAYPKNVWLARSLRRG